MVDCGPGSTSTDGVGQGPDGDGTARRDRTDGGRESGPLIDAGHDLPDRQQCSMPFDRN